MASQPIKPICGIIWKGEREAISAFIQALEHQRRRLFLLLNLRMLGSTPGGSVYTALLGSYWNWQRRSRKDVDITRLTEQLIRGLNRTFCGMMIDDGTQVYLASSGGDGRGRIASVLNYDLRTAVHRRDIYVKFGLAEDNLTPQLLVVDPTMPEDQQIIDRLGLQLTHFEYLIRVAGGSLPESFSRQCYEDFLDFKLRLIGRLDELIGPEVDGPEIALHAITVDENGRPQVEDIRIRVGEL